MTPGHRHVARRRPEHFCRARLQAHGMKVEGFVLGAAAGALCAYWWLRSTKKSEDLSAVQEIEFSTKEKHYFQEGLIVTRLSWGILSNTSLEMEPFSTKRFHTQPGGIELWLILAS